jgi:hypothetical protein
VTISFAGVLLILYSLLNIGLFTRFDNRYYLN